MPIKKSTWSNVVFAGVAFAAAFLAFLPALHAQFLNWDDKMVLLDNARRLGLGWTQIRWMFTHYIPLDAELYYLRPYIPLTWLSYSIDSRLWGLNPFGFHLTNVLLHAANAGLFYSVSFRLIEAALPPSSEEASTRARAAALLSALLFAVHPLRVESVAWVVERRDVLSGLFYLSTIIFYLRAQREPEGRDRRRALVLAVAAYVCSLLSKSAAVTLPFTLLLIDFYPLRRWSRSAIVEKLPFAAAAAVFGVAGLLARPQGGAPDPESPIVRLAHACYSSSFYLWKTLLPVGLSPVYETLDAANPFSGRFIVGACVTAALSVAFWAGRRRFPAGLTVWINYLLVLAPVSGLVRFGQHLVADRYSYLSILGWNVLVCGLLLSWWNAGGRRRALSAVLGILWVAAVPVFGVMTWRQTAVWHDSESFWRGVLARYPASSAARQSLGSTFLEQGRAAEAEAEYREALRLDPANALAHVNFGGLLAARGDLSGAVEHDRAALRANPRGVEAHNNLALALAGLGARDEAAAEYATAIALRPERSDVRANYGMLLTEAGRYDEAGAQLAEALRLDADNAAAHVHLGNLLRRRGRLDEAAAHYLTALRLRPDYGAVVQVSLGNVLFAAGRPDEAAARYREALRLDPGNAEARKNLAVATKRPKS